MRKMRNKLYKLTYTNNRYDVKSKKKNHQSINENYIHIHSNLKVQTLTGLSIYVMATLQL